MRVLSSHKTLLAFLILCIILVTTTGTFAWDGERKGFILGLGVGPGIDIHKQKAEVLGFEIPDSGIDESKFSIFTDFKLGYAPSNILQIYYVNKVCWLKGDWLDVRGMDFGYYADVMILSGLTGVGVTYYFAPVAPSPFISGGVGLATSLPFESGANSRMGFGFFAGGGYEFAKHWSVEGSFRWGHATNTEILDFSTDDITLSVTVNALGY